MSTDAKPTPIASRLRALLAEGSDLGSKPTVAVMRSNAWIMKARVILTLLYGESAPEIDFWCPRQSGDLPTMTGQDKILVRLPQLERLAATLAAPPATAKVFIGHGRSGEWLKLRLFLSQTIGLACDEFNIEPTAGLQTTSRIDSMLVSARMAFLVMTGEDRHADGTVHARENVIHEIGLLQSKLGSKRAIVLLESGCSRFSNLDGLTTINFPAGDIMARSEEIRGVLSRERIHPTAGA